MLDFVRTCEVPYRIISYGSPGEKKKKSAMELAGLRILDDEEDLLRNC